jgi:hypothetical protein
MGDCKKFLDRVNRVPAPSAATANRFREAAYGRYTSKASPVAKKLPPDW